MTIWEFAKKAHVSIATVSRAMNPETRHKVSAETLERLEVLAQKYGYTPNLAAKHLRGSAFKTIGVLMPHLRGIFFSDYYAKVLSGVADALIDTDYRFKAVLLKPGQEKWDKYNFKMGESVDGLIVTHWPNFFSGPKVLEKLNVPCAVISDPEKNVKALFAGGDNRQGGRLAAEYLASRGHRRVAVLSGHSWSSDSRLRVSGFKSAFEKACPSGRIEVLDGGFQERMAGALAERVLNEKKGITAFFCCNDLMACGVLEKLKEMGVRCPEEVSVMGYDDDQRAQVSDPPLTTVKVPLYELTKEAARRLVEHLQNGGEKKLLTGEALYPVEIAQRRSVRAPR